MRITLLSREEGQSTVEFALSMVLLMAFLLFYFQLCMVFAYGSYVHYATFMSARAYLSAGPDEREQKSRAEKVIVGMLKKTGQAGSDKFSFIGRGVGGDPLGIQIGEGDRYSAANQDFSWAQGVRYTFRSRLFVIPLGGFGRKEGEPSVNSVTLTSESWLGRESTTQECVTYMGGKGGAGKDGWRYDNGC